MLDFTEIDALARAGFEFSAGRGCIPPLLDQLSIDAFNAGISNYNTRYEKNVSKVLESSRTLQDGTNTGQSADKQLAIVGA